MISSDGSFVVRNIMSCYILFDNKSKNKIYFSVLLIKSVTISEKI